MDQIRIPPSFRGFRVMVILPPKATGFQSTRAKERIRKLLQRRRQRLLDRIAPRPAPESDSPMITASNIHYELGERARGLAPAALAALPLPPRRTGRTPPFARASPPLSGPPPSSDPAPPLTTPSH